MIWCSLIVLVFGAGAVVLGWRAHRWHCQRANPSCPTWQQQCKLGWKARLRNRYRNSSYEHHPTPPAERIDESNCAGVPSTRRDTPSAETIPNNPKRRTTP